MTDSEKKEYIVPMRVKLEGVVDAFVEASSPEEAAALCEAGNWDDMDEEGLELTDFGVAGKVEENF